MTTSRATEPAVPVSARRQQTRERLLHAAAEVFAERGFGAASVEEICERAGFTRGAFYSNFADKDELVAQLSRSQLDELLTLLEAAEGLDEPTPEALVASVLASWDRDPQARQRWLVLNLELTLHAMRDPQARRAWADRQQEVCAAIAARAERLASLHGLHLTAAPELFAQIAMALVTGGMAQEALIPPGRRRAAGRLPELVLPHFVERSGTLES